MALHVSRNCSAPFLCSYFDMVEIEAKPTIYALRYRVCLDIALNCDRVVLVFEA